MNRSLPERVTGIGGMGILTDVTAIAAGSMHALALIEDGTVRAWGWNSDGQLGHGSLYFSSASPVVVGGIAPDKSFVLGPYWGALKNVRSIAAGSRHSLALLNDGRVVAWGSNNQGQLGDGTDANQRSRPVLVKGPRGEGVLDDVKTVAAGVGHSLAIRNDGRAWAWGSNVHGELGAELTDNSSNTPVLVEDFRGFDAISAGFDHSLGIADVDDLGFGRVVSWGSNFFGELGYGGMQEKRAPVVVEAPGQGSYFAIAAGRYSSIAILASN